MAKKIWFFYLSDGMRAYLAQACNVDQAAALSLFVFIAACHDIAKATPIFQAKTAAYPPCDLDLQIADCIRNAGFVLRDEAAFTGKRHASHAQMGEKLLLQFGCNPNAAAVVGAHHGRPNDGDPQISVEAYSEQYYLNQTWKDAQQEVLTLALALSGFQSVSDLPRPSQPAQMLFSALLIMADWLASNERAFPYMEVGRSVSPAAMRTRTEHGWAYFSLQSPLSPSDAWQQVDLYGERFDYTPNAMQQTVRQCVGGERAPSLVVIEAPMGQGKTEAALVAAEVIENRTGRAGLFFALPTQATTDAAFARVLAWTERLMPYDRFSVRLAHGKAQFNDNYADLPTGGAEDCGDASFEGAYTNAWFEGGKRALLADYVVGTIDQLLLMALQQKHVMLRHLGLADKVVVIDECHAYDAYMCQYLNRALAWLGAYHTPVIIMSATLPTEKRDDMIAAYLGKSGGLRQSPLCVEAAYPRITCVTDEHVTAYSVPTDCISKQVEVAEATEEDLASYLASRLKGGGCVGVVVNTVAKAQRLYANLCEQFGAETVALIHARFLAEDRAEKERTLLAELGKNAQARPQLRIVVGTQVLEQSLDIDFDLLITELCPMDILLQRIGRLHRHTRKRPPLLDRPVCVLLSADSLDAGSAGVYGACLLQRTRALLPSQIIIPDQIPLLVERVYDLTDIPDGLPDDYQTAYEAHLLKMRTSKSAANSFRLPKPSRSPNGTIVGLLNSDVPFSEQRCDAAVREGDASVEVLVLQESEGRFRCVPWHTFHPWLAPNAALGMTDGKAIARQCLRLPPQLCRPWTIEATLRELERQTERVPLAWRQSPWLAGQLFLLLDNAFSAPLNGFRIHYDPSIGLTYTKEESE